MNKEKLKRLPFVSSIYRALYPNYSTCGCCGLPWAVVEKHMVDMEIDNNGFGGCFFPVCEYCWQNKSQFEINVAIVNLYHKWEHECTEIPYTLDDMIKSAVAQRNPIFVGSRCAACAKECKKMHYWFNKCKNYLPKK